MPANPRNVPLIERRADARVLEDQIREHRKDCRYAGRCPEARAMREELKAIREELRTWFAPGADQPPLFETTQAIA